MSCSSPAQAYGSTNASTSAPAQPKPQRLHPPVSLRANRNCHSVLPQRLALRPLLQQGQSLIPSESLTHPAVPPTVVYAKSLVPQPLREIPYSFSFRYSVVFPIPSNFAAISLSPFNCRIVPRIACFSISAIDTISPSPSDHTLPPLQPLLFLAIPPVPAATESSATASADRPYAAPAPTTAHKPAQSHSQAPAHSPASHTPSSPAASQSENVRFTPLSFSIRSRKCIASGAISSRRFRNGGIRRFTTFNRK